MWSKNDVLKMRVHTDIQACKEEVNKRVLLYCKLDVFLIEFSPSLTPLYKIVIQ